MIFFLSLTMIDPNVYPSSKRIFIFELFFVFLSSKKKRKKERNHCSPCLYECHDVTKHVYSFAAVVKYFRARNWFFSLRENKTRRGPEGVGGKECAQSKWRSFQPKNLPPTKAQRVSRRLRGASREVEWARHSFALIFIHFPVIWLILPTSLQHTNESFINQTLDGRNSFPIPTPCGN